MWATLRNSSWLRCCSRRERRLVISSSTRSSTRFPTTTSRAPRRFWSATLGILCFQERALCVLCLRTSPSLTDVAGLGLLGEVRPSINLGGLFGELASVLGERFVRLLLDSGNVVGHFRRFLSLMFAFHQCLRPLVILLRPRPE